MHCWQRPIFVSVETTYAIARNAINFQTLVPFITQFGLARSVPGYYGHPLFVLAAGFKPASDQCSAIAETGRDTHTIFPGQDSRGFGARVFCNSPHQQAGPAFR